MAKSSRFTRNEARNPRSKSISSATLIAETGGLLTPAEVRFLFTSGIGQATATLFRNGVLINMESISSSGVINFSDVKKGDAISVNGICTGRLTITVSRTTIPETPESFASGIIMAGYLIN